ncbi:uncharacterized protein EV154DRAFT_603050 [Mucor mucedo]|uniref:uncharacterized protein n=1 Tax=Mucor mucedo TaxID=29922 RepID=UPI0022211A01|nr:uncharacterized protein EV154DRAFT_603050 [Mucor mucedo]KAI7890686.1 hypothetical protein EV154DRAFT_603050 [Mucor mucedo]
MNSDLDFQDTRVPSFISFDSDSPTRAKKLKKRKRKSQNDTQPVTKKSRKRLPKNGTLDSFITKEVNPTKPKETHIWVGAVVNSEYGAYGVFFGDNDERNFGNTFIIEDELQNSDYGHVLGALHAINSLKTIEPIVINVSCRGLPQAITNPDKKYHYKELADQIRDKITENKRDITVRHISARSNVDEHKLALALASDTLGKLKKASKELMEDKQPVKEDVAMQDTIVEDIATEESMSVDITLEDSSENVTVEDTIEKDDTVEYVTTEDITVEDITVEDITVEDITVEDITAEGVTVEDVTVEDITVEDITVEDVIVEDVTVEVTVNEVAAEDDTISCIANDVDLEEAAGENDPIVKDVVVTSDIIEIPVAEDATDVSVTTVLTVTTVVEEVTEVLTTETQDGAKEVVDEDNCVGQNDTIKVEATTDDKNSVKEVTIEDLDVREIEATSDSIKSTPIVEDNVEPAEINQEDTEEIKETSSWASVFGIRGLLDVLYSPFKSRKS